MFKPKIVPQETLTDGAILIVDVDYRDGYAVASGVIIEEWDSTECAVVNAVVEDVHPYEPGAFYKRELPCIMELLKHVTLGLGVIVIDGYVKLGADQHDGLGAHLQKRVHTPVVGVAKTYFEGTPDSAKVLRRGSIKPLFVTCVGGDHEAAKSCVDQMAGDHRIPGMIKFVDHCCRSYVRAEAIAV